MTDARLVRVLLVGALLLAALAIRVAYIENTSYRAVNDAGTYNRLASMVARYGDYHTGNRPRTAAGNSRGPTAYFPPGFPYYLAVWDLVTGHQSGKRPAAASARIEQALGGTLAVALIGLVALEATGGVVALAAMVLAAVYPVFVELSGTLVAENLLVLLELAATWTALRGVKAVRPWPWIAATGALTGLATLTHQNAILLLLPFAVAAAWSHGAGVLRRGGTLGRIGLLVLVTAITIAPWTIRNAVELHAFIPISTESGLTLVGTYNPNSAANASIPWKWRYFDKIPQDATLVRRAGRYSELALNNKLQGQALNYIGAHPLAPFDVAWHNTLRLLELEGSTAWHESAIAIGLSVGAAQVGVIAFWILGLLAVAGAFTRLARQAPGWLWAIPLLLALSVVPINVETPRFREPVDPFLVLLAGCALATAAERAAALLGRHRAGSASGLGRTPVGRGETSGVA